MGDRLKALLRLFPERECEVWEASGTSRESAQLYIGLARSAAGKPASCAWMIQLSKTGAPAADFQEATASGQRCWAASATRRNAAPRRRSSGVRSGPSSDMAIVSASPDRTRRASRGGRVGRGPGGQSSRASSGLRGGRSPVRTSGRSRSCAPPSTRPRASGRGRERRGSSHPPEARGPPGGRRSGRTCCPAGPRARGRT